MCGDAPSLARGGAGVATSGHAAGAMDGGGAGGGAVSGGGAGAGGGAAGGGGSDAACDAAEGGGGAERRCAADGALEDELVTLLRALQRPGGEHAEAWAGAMRRVLSAALGLAPSVHAWLTRASGDGGDEAGHADVSARLAERGLAGLAAEGAQP